MYLEKLGHQLQQLTKTVPSSPFFRRPTAIWKTSCSRVSSTNSDYHETKGGLVDRWLGPNAGVSRPEEGTNRWSMLVPAFLTHACLGAPYGWSAVTSALTREQGVVVSAAGDWGLDLATYPMTIMIGGGGLAAAALGKWAAKAGPRRAMVQGSLIASVGYASAGASIMQHNLAALYLSIGLIALGNGSVYTPPVQTIIDWFPDRKGLATGIVIGGFGSGALFFAPAMNFLMSKFSVAPAFLGNGLDLVTEGGRQFAQVGGQLQEVVYASASELARLPFEGLAEGFYLVGSGNTGVALAYTTMGLAYTAIVLASSLALKRAPPGFQPQGWTPSEGAAAPMARSVHVDLVARTPQFWLLFSTSALLCTGGMGLMAVAKPMITEVFSTSVPALVTTSFATIYLMAMAAGNLAGRIGWAAVSDQVGRRTTYLVFTTAGAATYASLPWLIGGVVSDSSSPLAPTLLAIFCANTIFAISIMGGVLATLPAYESDLFGPRHVGAIHSRFLLSTTVAALAGPALLLNLRSSAERDAIASLASKANPEVFLAKFGADPSQLETLVAAKTVTIPRLLEIAPQGTLDPSPFIYNSTLYTMAGLVSVGAGLHFMVRPVNSKYFDLSEEIDAKEAVNVAAKKK